MTLGIISCSPEPQTDEGAMLESTIEPHRLYVLPGFSSEESARARLVWEAARAMVGPANASAYTWPTGTVYSSFNYAADDPTAWTMIRNSTSYGPSGYWLTCRADNGGTNYSPCYISTNSTNPSTYGYQGGYYRGGQCKAFTNLVAWRSTVYRGTDNAFKSLPTNGDTWVTPQNIRSGDILRMPTTHSLIVARVFVENGATKAVVIDSNYVNGTGDGYEIIGTHVLGFSGTGSNDLSHYKAYQCVYNGTC